MIPHYRQNSSHSKVVAPIQAAVEVWFQVTAKRLLVPFSDLEMQNLNTSQGHLAKSELSPTIKFEVHGGVEIRKNSRLHHMLPPDILMLKGEVLRSAISHYEVDHMIHLANMRKQMYEKYCAKQSASIQSGAWKPQFSGLVMKGGSIGTKGPVEIASDGVLQAPKDVHIQRFLMRYKENYKQQTTQETSSTKQSARLAQSSPGEIADSRVQAKAGSQQIMTQERLNQNGGLLPQLAEQVAQRLSFQIPEDLDETGNEDSSVHMIEHLAPMPQTRQRPQTAAPTQMASRPFSALVKK